MRLNLCKKIITPVIVSSLLAVSFMFSCKKAQKLPASPPPGREYGNPFLAVEHVCAWPNLTIMPDGNIVAAIFNKPSHGAVPGDVECWASEDGGWTWQYRGTPARHEGNTNRMNCAAGLAANGDLIALVSGWDNPGGEPNNKLPCWICRSSDGGRTWIVSDNFPVSPAGTGFVPFGDIIIAENSSLRAGAYTDNTSFMLQSDDDGYTWQLSSSISTPGDEPVLFNMGAGKWLVANRISGSGNEFLPVWYAAHLELSRSYDDGRTWSIGEKITEAGQHPAHIMRLKDGRLLLTYGDRHAERLGIVCRLSSDGGKTWGEPMWLARHLDSGDLGYPSSVQRQDGKIVTAFYASILSEGKEYKWDENAKKYEDFETLPDDYYMGVVIWDLHSEKM